jgi:hypothetical protein
MNYFVANTDAILKYQEESSQQMINQRAHLARLVEEIQESTSLSTLDILTPHLELDGDRHILIDEGIQKEIIREK